MHIPNLAFALTPHSRQKYHLDLETHYVTTSLALVPSLSTATHANLAFAPQSKAELKSAVDTCGAGSNDPDGKGGLSKFAAELIVTAVG